MKSKNLFFTLFILIFVGLAIYGYFSAIPGVEDQTEKRPEIEITPKSFDFGEIEYGEIVKYTFKVRNLGEEVLEIKRVATSCGCTTAEVTKDRIVPGEEADLNVTYDTGAMSGSHAKGNQDRIIYVKSNDPINPQFEVIITAYVK